MSAQETVKDARAISRCLFHSEYPEHRRANESCRPSNCSGTSADWDIEQAVRAADKVSEDLVDALHDNAPEATSCGGTEASIVTLRALSAYAAAALGRKSDFMKRPRRPSPQRPSLVAEVQS